MRFFKSFKLLHRRTKSEPSITLASGRLNLREAASSSDNLPSTLLPIATIAPDVLPVPNPNIRILDLEIENSRFRKISAATCDELATVKAQLTATQADLFAELHRSARQRQSDQNEIRKLHEKVAQYEEFIVNVSANETLPGMADFSHVIDQALSSIVEREANLGASNPIGVVSSSFGFRSRDQYMSALQLTLKSRSQLRQYKKIAKFWKKTALQDTRNVSLVTPSASIISSIIETLPLDRQKAVDDLITRRKVTELTSLPELLETPRRSEPATTETAIEAAGLSPSRSLPQSRPCLSPLASQSLRQELHKFASTNRLANWPHISRRPLEQLDLNVRSHYAECAVPICRKQHSIKPIPIRDRQRATKRRPMSNPFAPVLESSIRNYSKCAIRNEFSGQAAPPFAVTATRLCSDVLGDINEENEHHSDSSFSSNITSLGWVDCQKEDLSLDSNTETLISTTPDATPVTKDPPRRNKSKIPLPVFKTLRRLSSTRLGTARAKDTVATSHRKKTIEELSPTRLPVRSR